MAPPLHVHTANISTMPAAVSNFEISRQMHVGGNYANLLVIIALAMANRTTQLTKYAVLVSDC